MEMMPWGVMVAMTTPTRRARKGGAPVLAAHWPGCIAADGPVRESLCVCVSMCACVCVRADGCVLNLSLSKRGNERQSPALSVLHVPQLLWLRGL